MTVDVTLYEFVALADVSVNHNASFLPSRWELCLNQSVFGYWLVTEIKVKQLLPIKSFLITKKSKKQNQNQTKTQQP